jgi:uncharacterized protein YbjQ (UPF0145 family)
MKKLIAVSVMAIVASGFAEARNDKLNFQISGVLSHPKASTVLVDNVALYFGNQSTPPLVDASRSLEVTTSKKTNGVNKSDEEACQWAMLSALKALQERAIREGANAVVNIRSNLNHQEFSSQTEYQCAAGNIMAGVALKARIASVKK